MAKSRTFFSKKLIFTICFLDVSEHLELIGPPFRRTFFYTRKISGPLWPPPQGPPRGPSLGLPFWNQKLTYKRPLHQIWHTFHNLKPPPQKSTFRPTLSEKVGMSQIQPPPYNSVPWKSRSSKPKKENRGRSYFVVPEKFFSTVISFLIFNFFLTKLLPT